jgi:hypothetical protein
MVQGRGLRQLPTPAVSIFSESTPHFQLYSPFQLRNEPVQSRTFPGDVTGVIVPDVEFESVSLWDGD